MDDIEEEGAPWKKEGFFDLEIDEVVEETKETEEFVVHWDEVKGDEGVGVYERADDGELEELKDGMVEEAKEDGSGEVVVG